MREKINRAALAAALAVLLFASGADVALAQSPGEAAVTEVVRPVSPADARTDEAPAAAVAHTPEPDDGSNLSGVDWVMERAKPFLTWGALFILICHVIGFSAFFIIRRKRRLQRVNEAEDESPEVSRDVKFENTGRDLRSGFSKIGPAADDEEKSDPAEEKQTPETLRTDEPDESDGLEEEASEEATGTALEAEEEIGVPETAVAYREMLKAELILARDFASQGATDEARELAGYVEKGGDSELSREAAEFAAGLPAARKRPAGI